MKESKKERERGKKGRKKERRREKKGTIAK